MRSYTGKSEMSGFDAAALTELFDHRSSWCVSLYTCVPQELAVSTEDSLPHPQEAWLRPCWEKLVRPLQECGATVAMAQKAWGAARITSRSAACSLRPDGDLHREPARADNRSGSVSSAGLAIFIAEGFVRWYPVLFPFSPTCEVHDRFQVAPLLSLLRANAGFHILALTLEHATLYEASQHGIAEVALPELALPEAETRGHEARELATPDIQEEKEDKGKGGLAIPPSQWLGQDVIRTPHEAANPPPVSKSDIQQYFLQVDRQVGEALRRRRGALVLASLGYLAAIYDSVSSHPQLLKTKIPGCPSGWTLDELRQNAWRLVQPHYRQSQQQAAAKFQQTQAGDWASDDLQEVVRAADEGRVETLLIREGAEARGTFDREAGRVQLQQPADASGGGLENLLELAEVRTLAAGGDVYGLDAIPGTAAPLAAVFRR